MSVSEIIERPVHQYKVVPVPQETENTENYTMAKAGNFQWCFGGADVFSGTNPASFEGKRGVQAFFLMFMQ